MRRTLLLKKDPNINDLYVLRLKDIKSSDSDESLRPFIFNLQQHMIDKAQGYVDHCVIHHLAGRVSTFVVGYRKKPDFFHVSQEDSSQLQLLVNLRSSYPSALKGIDPIPQFNKERCCW